MALCISKNSYKRKEIGAISIGLPAVGYSNDVSVVADNFITGVACKLLSLDEKNQLAELSKADAIKIKNAKVILDNCNIEFESK